jgi:hypothetical protein
MNPSHRLRTTSQPGRAAGLGAVALAVLVAIAVAALFLALIGADRSDQVAGLITTARLAPTAREVPQHQGEKKP